MGDTKSGPIRLSFNPQLRVEFRGAAVTSDARPLLPRQAMSRVRTGGIGWDKVLLPVVDRYLAQGQTVAVRADAAFALPALYEALERRGVAYAIRLPANDVLERWSISKILVKLLSSRRRGCL